MKVSQTISFHYDVPGDDFTRAGEASSSIKKALKQVGLAPDIIRNVAIRHVRGRNQYGHPRRRWAD